MALMANADRLLVSPPEIHTADVVASKVRMARSAIEGAIRNGRRQPGGVETWLMPIMVCARRLGLRRAVTDGVNQ